MSRWLFVVVSFAALFVAAGKRYADFMDPASRRSRRVLAESQTGDLLRIVIGGAAAVAVALLPVAALAGGRPEGSVARADDHPVHDCAAPVRAARDRRSRWGAGGDRAVRPVHPGDRRGVVAHLTLRPVMGAPRPRPAQHRERATAGSVAPARSTRTASSERRRRERHFRRRRRDLVLDIAVALALTGLSITLTAGLGVLLLLEIPIAAVLVASLVVGRGRGGQRARPPRHGAQRKRRRRAGSRPPRSQPE